MTLRQSRAELVRRVSDWLVPLGFELDPQGMAHVNYRGTWNGRHMRVQASVRTRGRSGGARRRAYAGLHLDVMVETSTRTRLVSHRPGKALGGLVRRVLKWKGLHRVDLPGGAGVELWAADPEWARRFATDPNVATTLEQVGVSRPDAAMVLRLGPKTLSLASSLTLEEVSPDRAESWLVAAAHLVKLAEMGAPPTPVELTWLEKQHAKNPRRAVILTALLIVLGLPLALLATVGTILGSIYWIGGSTAVSFALVAFAAVFMPVAMLLAIVKIVRGLSGRSGR